MGLLGGALTSRIRRRYGFLVAAVLMAVSLWHVFIGPVRSIRDITGVDYSSITRIAFRDGRSGALTVVEDPGKIEEFNGVYYDVVRCDLNISEIEVFVKSAVPSH